VDIITKIESKIQAARAEVQAMLTKATAESRSMADEEKVRATALTAQLETLEVELKKEKAQLEHDRYHAVPIDRAGGMQAPRPKEGVPGAAPKYADLFGAAAKSDQFQAASDFYEAVASGRHHPGLMAAMNEGVPSEGGFLVPTEYSAEAFDESLEAEVVRPRARVYGMKSDSRKVSGFAMDGDAATGPYGWQPGWVAEGGAIPVAKPLLRMVDLVARKLGVIVQASGELVADGLSYGQQLDQVLRNAIGWQLDYEFLHGNGAGKPIGVIDAPCTVSVAKETVQTAATIVSQNVLKMYSRLLPASFRRAVWVAHPNTLPQLMTMVLPAGVAGTPFATTPFFSMDAGRMTLLNLPVVLSEKMATLGTKGDIGLFDFSFYAVGLRKEITLDRSAHVGFANDIESFRALLRADGKPLLSQAYTPKTGATLSPFVVLADRA